MSDQPQVIILGGPNGAGKSTAAPRLLVDELKVTEFVNADVIARGLSGFSPELVAIRAGRILLERIHELAGQRSNFAFETTLASRTFAPFISKLRGNGYAIRVAFLWLPTARMAIDRVAERVRMGGHTVPVETIQRRYAAGLRNFVNLYLPLADDWSLFDNSGASGPRLVASGGRGIETSIIDMESWDQISRIHT
jgi:predicted ABC-type ATPase